MRWDKSGFVSASRHRWWRFALAICAAGALAMGLWGFLRKEVSLPEALYQTLQLFFLRSPGVEAPLPWRFEVARWLAVLTALWAAIEVGVALFREEWAGFWLRRMKGHTILCGLGQKTMQVIGHLRAAGEKVVVIDKAPPTDLVQDCRLAHALVLVGSATDAGVLNLAGVKRARQVFALCPADSTNCEIAAQVRRVRT